MISGDVNSYNIEIKTARGKLTSHRPARAKTPSLPPTLPTISDNNMPALEFGLRGRLLLPAPAHPININGPARSAAVGILNDNSALLTGPNSVLRLIMATWYDDTWNASKWQLHGPASAREANARWVGLSPDGGRIAEARLALELVPNRTQAPSLIITIFALLANPFRPDPFAVLEEMMRQWDDDPRYQHGSPRFFEDRPKPPRKPELLEEPTPPVTLLGLKYLMHNVAATLWGPLGETLSAHLLGQPLGPPAELDIAVFTIPHNHGTFLPARGENADIPINKYINFGSAALIPGASPHACTLLEAINPDVNLSDDARLQETVAGWLTTFCLDNGYQDFEQEIIRDTQPQTQQIEGN